MPAATGPPGTFTGFEKSAPAVLLILDVVESVRLMAHDEQGIAQRWHVLVQTVQQAVLPRFAGRMVKSLGDGLILEFSTAQQAIGAAFEVRQISQAANAPHAEAQRMHLRMGAHRVRYLQDEFDIYGADVNLVMRLTTLAGPDEIVVSDTVRDELTASLDAEIEDLGDCHLKHIPEPVRTYRVGPPGKAPVLQPVAASDAGDFRPAIAVIPFEARSHEPEHFVIGELIADGVIAQLSKSAQLRVISRLSTTAFRGRDAPVPAVRDRLAATYVLAGSYVASGGKLLIMAELTDTRNGELLWAERVAGDLQDLLQAQSELLNRLAVAASKAVIDVEVQQSQVQPLPRLDSSALLLGGISHMHRSSARDFDRSRLALETLAERHNRVAAPRAWLGKWYIMRVVRGMSDSPERDSRRAMEQTERALDVDPGSALALAVQGHAQCHFSDDAPNALRTIDAAIALNPNESLAWLYKSVWSTMWGSSAASVEEAEAADRLSPIDPMRYYFDSLLATSYTINGDYEKAIVLALRSLRANLHHQPTLRTLLLAQGESGRVEEARQTLLTLRRYVPDLTVARYLSIGGATSTSRRRFAEVLRLLKVPEV